MPSLRPAGYLLTVCWTIAWTTRGATPREMVLCGKKMRVWSEEEPTAVTRVSHSFLDVTEGLVPRLEYTVEVRSSDPHVILLSDGHFRASRPGVELCGPSNGTLRTTIVPSGLFSALWVPDPPAEDSRIRLTTLSSRDGRRWTRQLDYYLARKDCFRVVSSSGDSAHPTGGFSDCSVLDIFPATPPEARQLVQFREMHLTGGGYLDLHLKREGSSDLLINQHNFFRHRYGWIQSTRGHLLLRLHSCQTCRIRLTTAILQLKNGCRAVLRGPQGWLAGSFPRECSFRMENPAGPPDLYLTLPGRKSGSRSHCPEDYATVESAHSDPLTLCPAAEDTRLLTRGPAPRVIFGGSRLHLSYLRVNVCANRTVTQASGRLCAPGHYGRCLYRINAPWGYAVELDFEYLETGRTADCAANYLTLDDGHNSTHWCGHLTGRTPSFRSAANSLNLRMTVQRPSEAGRGFCARYRAVPVDLAFTACPYGWVSGPHFCYRLWATPVNWTSAGGRCRDEGGHLATVDGPAIQDLLDHLLSTSVNLSTEEAVWIGGTDATYENSFQWDDGRPFRYTNWFAGWKEYGGYNAQPNDDGLADQDCIEMRKVFGYPGKGSGPADSFYWNDRDCRVANPFVCQKLRPGVSVPVPAAPDCQRTIRLDTAGDRETLASPDYPQPYPVDVRCRVRVEAPPGRRIRLQFSDFLLEDDPSCGYDYLEIEDGGDAGPARYCGDWRSRIKLLSRTSASNLSVVIFVSDSSHTYAGFKAEVSLLPEKEASWRCENHLFHSYGSNCYLMSSYPEVSWETAERICTESQGQLATVGSSEERRFLHSLIVSSEDYTSGVVYWIGSKKEPGQAEWKWLNGEKISSDLLDVEGSSAEPRASCLGIQWRHGNRTGRLFWSAKRCNHSGRYICKKQAFVVPDQLNATVKNSSGTLTSVNYPAHYTHDLDYVVKIETSPGSRIVVTVDHLEIEWQENCLYDYLEITHTLDQPGSRFCGSLVDQKSNFVSPEEVVLIVFHSDYSVAGRGFSLRWESVTRRGCGQWPGSFRTVASPHWRGRSLPGLDCSFRLSSPSRILLTFHQFRVGMSDGRGGCGRDHLRMDLGGEEERSLLLCGHSASVPRGLAFLSYGDRILVRFRTAPGRRLGQSRFLLVWDHWNGTQLEIGVDLRNITDRPHRLHSLNFPLPPPSQVRFGLRLRVGLGFRIRLLGLLPDPETGDCPTEPVLAQDPYGDTRPVSCAVRTTQPTSTLDVLRFLSPTSTRYSVDFQVIPDPDYLEKTLKMEWVDSCHPDPCLGGGQCRPMGDRARCHCLGAYTGAFCHLEWCQTRPCGPRGVCHPRPAGYRCDCQPEYVGARCQEKVGPCYGRPCGSHGRCSVFNDTFICHCHRWYEGSRCERYVFRIPYKPLSRRMLEEPFWLGLITVSAVLLVILCVYCIKRKFAEKIERLLAEEIEKSKRNPSPPAARYSLSSNQLSLTPGSQSPQNCPKSLFTVFRKYSVRSTTSGPSPTDRDQAGTFSFDDLTGGSAKRSQRTRAASTTHQDEKSRILAALVTRPQTRRLSLDELVRMSERKLREANQEDDPKETDASETESLAETSFAARLSPRLARHSAPSFTEFHSIRELSMEYASSTDSDPETQTGRSRPNSSPASPVVSTPPLVPGLSAASDAPPPSSVALPETDKKNDSITQLAPPEPQPCQRINLLRPTPLILVTGHSDWVESDPSSPPTTPRPVKSRTYLTPDRTISESNLSTSGYSSLSSRGPSPCNSGSPICHPDETEKVPSPHRWRRRSPNREAAGEAQRTNGPRSRAEGRWPDRPPCPHHRPTKRQLYQTSTDESVEDEGIGPDPPDWETHPSEGDGVGQWSVYPSKKASSPDSASSPGSRSSCHSRKTDKGKKGATKGRRSPAASPTPTEETEAHRERYHRPKLQTRRSKKEGVSGAISRSAPSERRPDEGSDSTALRRWSPARGPSIDDSVESSVASDTDEEKSCQPLLSTDCWLRRQEALPEESDSADSSSETTVLLGRERISIAEVEEIATQTDLTSAYGGQEASFDLSSMGPFKSTATGVCSDNLKN